MKTPVALRLSPVALEDVAVLQAVWGVTRTAAIERAVALARYQAAPRRMAAGPVDTSVGDALREMRRTRRTDTGPLSGSP